MKHDDIKKWVDQHCKITQPHSKYFSASVTLAGTDVNGTGNTAEAAKKRLVTRIQDSPYYNDALKKLLS